jgi:molybdopterin synthase sulfur carrier subunit
MITINFYATLRLYLKLREIQIDLVQEAPIHEVLCNIEDAVFEKTAKRFMKKFVDDNGELQPATMILINGKNILDTEGLNTLVRDGDTVALFPQAGGG